MTCGAQTPGGIPGSFDWWPIAALGTVGATGAYVATSGVPGVNQILVGLGYAPTASTFGLPTITGAFAGAALMFVLVLYFALKPDGCIRSVPEGAPVCFSGIVQDVSDTSSTAAAVLAPFAIPPSGIFNVVVKDIYLNLVMQNAHWVFCSPDGSPMLPCVVKSKTACGGKIGSLAGVTLGAIAGTVIGYVAAAALGAAIGCAAAGPFYLLCLLVVVIVAAIVAAAVAFVGALIGGWIGQAIATGGSDPVGDAWQGLDRGAIVTVKGNWVTDPDTGSNQIYFVTDLHRTGMADPKPSYSTADAAATAADDCPLVPIR